MFLGLGWLRFCFVFGVNYLFIEQVQVLSRWETAFDITVVVLILFPYFLRANQRELALRTVLSLSTSC